MWRFAQILSSPPALSFLSTLSDFLIMETNKGKNHKCTSEYICPNIHILKISRIYFEIHIHVHIHIYLFTVQNITQRHNQVNVLPSYFTSLCKEPIHNLPLFFFFFLTRRCYDPHVTCHNTQRKKRKNASVEMNLLTPRRAIIFQAWLLLLLLGGGLREGGMREGCFWLTLELGRCFKLVSAVQVLNWLGGRGLFLSSFILPWS